MLIAPEVLWQEPITVLALVLLIIVAKGVFAALALRLVGFDAPRALLSALLLAQVGEFSFVIASQALDDAVITEDLASAFLVAAVISILLSPGLFSLGLRVWRPDDTAGRDQPRGHVVICGYDQSTKALARALAGRRFAFVVVDTNPALLDDTATSLSRHDFLFGDPLHPEVLAEAGIEHARVLAITDPYGRAAARLAENARSMNPRIGIVATSDALTYTSQPEVFGELVNPSLEGNLELMRRVLHIYGVAEAEIRAEEARQRLTYLGAN
jgi:CPA2 family monovalent cation:H+ antiporter-2